MKWSKQAIMRAKIGTGEAQRYEPGINAVDNCGPACGAVLMMLLGYPDIEPQDWVGPNYRGGTTASQLNAFIATHYPNPPPMRIAQSTAKIADLTEWASHDWLSIGLFYSDAAAVIKPYPTNILHWAIPVEDDGAVITIWNPEWATYDRFSYADFIKASLGQFDVCQRAIMGGDMNYTPQQKANWVRQTFQQLLGRQPTDAEGLNWTKYELADDGSNVDAAYLKVYNSQESKNYRDKLAKALTAGGGAAVDTSKLSVKGHKHPVTATISTSGDT
jgi:hypothetical protein